MKTLQLFWFIYIMATSEVFAQLNHRIISSRKCSMEEYPLFLTIKQENRSRVFCGGSLIEPNWMLTAARCCEAMNPISNFSVRAGETRWMLDAVAHSSIKWISHEDYEDEPLTADVCLVKLTQPFKPSARIKLSKLATTADYNRLIKNGKCKALVMGFGEETQNSNSTERVYNPEIKCANLPILPQSKCNEDIVIANVVSEDVFCMENEQRNTIKTCYDHSGGPVYCENLQIGIVSTGYGCGEPGYPGFYTRVDLYRDAIENVIQMKKPNLRISSVATFLFPNMTVDLPSTPMSALMEERNDTRSSAVRSDRFCKMLVIFAITMAMWLTAF